MEAYRRQTGKNGVELVSLMHYIKSSPYFIGSIRSYRFANSVSSCFVFDYKDMKVNLTRSWETEDDSNQKKPASQNAESLSQSDNDDLPF